MKFRQFLSALLLMVLTTTVVNTHALSHLFDSDFSSIEHCDTCDEYLITSQDDLYIAVPVFEVFNTESVDIFVSTSITTTDENPVFSCHTGQYFNKPPPLS